MNVPSESLNMNTCWINIEISRYFSFWKLDYFFDLFFLRNIFDTTKNLGWQTLYVLLLNPANHIEFFSVIPKPDMEPWRILLNINPIPIIEIPTKYRKFVY